MTKPNMLHIDHEYAIFSTPEDVLVSVTRSGDIEIDFGNYILHIPLEHILYSLNCVRNSD